MVIYQISGASDMGKRQPGGANQARAKEKASRPEFL